MYSIVLHLGLVPAYFNMLIGRKATKVSIDAWLHDIDIDIAWEEYVLVLCMKEKADGFVVHFYAVTDWFSTFNDWETVPKQQMWSKIEVFYHVSYRNMPIIWKKVIIS